VYSVVRAAAVSGQRLDKHISAATDTNSTIEERRFLCGPCRDIISKGQMMTNHDNENVRNIGQGEARHSKYKRLKLGGGQAHDHSSD
jgi:hypothetical protein